MRSGKKTSSDGPGLIEAFRARISANNIKIHSNGGKHRQTGTHNAMGASAKGNVKIHIETQYPNSNVRTYNPYPAVGIPSSMISASFENFEYSAGALF